MPVHLCVVSHQLPSRSQRVSSLAPPEYKARNCWPHKPRAVQSPASVWKSHPSSSSKIISIPLANAQTKTTTQGRLKASYEAETSKYQASPSFPESEGESVHEVRILRHSNYINDFNSLPFSPKPSLTSPAQGMEFYDSLRKPKALLKPSF